MIRRETPAPKAKDVEGQRREINGNDRGRSGLLSAPSQSHHHMVLPSL